jgi:hypothetical protein
MSATGPTRNVENGYNGRMDLIVVRYSVPNNDLPSKTRFRFQGKVVKANCIRERTVCAMSLHKFVF